MSVDASRNQIKTGYAPVNGIEMYYEIHGKNEHVPLVLIHGGGSTIEASFSQVLPLFARHRQVVALEEQGHGRTSDRNAPVRFDTSADDVAALLEYLKIPKADLLGFSNGASVALQVAIRHPEFVRKLVFASSMTKKSGAHSEFWAGMKQANFSDMPQSLKEAFLKVNQDPQKLRTMHDKDAARMANFQDVRDDEVKAIRAPTLILMGDRDIPTPEHGVELSHLISESRLLILPGGHGDYLGEVGTIPQDNRMPELVTGLIEEFLNMP
jgi:pimeloyl-ACP methyl ester carboxylesterase